MPRLRPHTQAERDIHGYRSTMTDVRRDRPMWPPLTVFLLTLAWLVGVAASFLRILYVDYATPDRTHGWVLLFFGWLAAGPLAIAGVAGARPAPPDGRHLHRPRRTPGLLLPDRRRAQPSGPGTTDRSGAGNGPVRRPQRRHHPMPWRLTLPRTYAQRIFGRPAYDGH